MTYKWKIPGVIPVTAQAAGEELERIYERDGIIEPEVVVLESESHSAPLHNCFEWNDTKAAHKYRIMQAQNIIRAIVTVEETEQTTVETRAFVNVQREYHPISVVMQSKEKQKLLLEKAIEELQCFEKKYNSLRELADVFEAIKKVSK